MYEPFEHTADVGLRVRAASLAELFAEAARGLCSLLVADVGSVRLVETRALRVEGEERELLLFDWLNELLYCFTSDKTLWRDFTIRLRPGGLDAECRGERVDEARHELTHEIKAVTYHGLRVEREGDGWLAEVIFDI